MAYIFLDESGDLGFDFSKKNTSKVFIITLQAVDFASWAIFRKYEKNDDSYYRIIKGKIIEENPLFP